MDTSKRPLGKLYIFLLSSLTGLMILVAIAPSFASTSIGTKLLCYILEKKYALHLQIKNLRLGWLTAQSAEEILVENSDHSFQSTAKNIHNTSALITMLFKDNYIGLTQIDSCDILLDAKKPSQQDTSAKKDLSKTSSRSFKLLQNIFIRDGSIQLKSSLSSTAINHFQLNLQLRHDAIIASSKGSSITKNIEGFFDIFCNIHLLNFDIEGHLNTSMFPLTIFDELFALNGLLEKTVGPTLNANSFFHFTDEKLSCSFELLSSLCKASINTSDSKEEVFLQKPSVVSWTVTPESVVALSDYFPFLENLALSQPGSLQLFLDELKVPYLKKMLNFEKARYKTRLFTSSLNFLHKKSQKPIVLNASTLSSSSDELGDSAAFSLKSSLNYNLKNPSFISGSAVMASPLKSPHFVNLQGKITKLPTILLEIFSSKTIDIIDLVGESFDATIATKNPGDHPSYSCSVFSPLISAESIEIDASSEGFFTKQPFQILYKTPKKSVKEFLASWNVHLSDIGMTKVFVETASLSKKGFSKEGLSAIKLNGYIHAEDILFSSSYLLGKSKLKNLHLDFDVPSLNKIDIKSSAALFFTDPEPLQQQLFGDMQELSAIFVLEKLTLNNLSVPYFKFSAANSKASANLACSLTENLQKFAFLEPLNIQLNLSPEIFNQIFQVSSQETAFLIPSPLKLTVNADPFYITDQSAKKLKLDASVKIPQIKIIDKIYSQEFNIQNTALVAQGDTSSATIKAHLTSEIVPSDVSKTKGTIDISFAAQDFSSLNFLEKPWSISGSATRIPTSVFDVALGLNSSFTTLVGSEFTSSFETSYQKNQSLISGNFQSSNLKVSYNLTKTPEMLFATEPVQGVLYLEKDSYSAFESLIAPKPVSLQTFALNSPSELSFSINKFQWLYQNFETTQGSWIERTVASISENLQRCLLDVALASDHIEILCQDNGQIATLDNLSFNCQKTEGMTPFVMNISSDVLAYEPKQDQEKGRFFSTIVLQNMPVKSKKNLLSTKIEGSLTKFPTMILDMAFQTAGIGNMPPSIILGKTLSSAFMAKFENSQGSIDAEIKAEQAEGQLNAYTDQGVMKLSKPLKATVNITPSLVNFFFKNMNINITQASAPLSLTIDNRGFYLPLDPYDFQSIQIRKASVNLGQITCTNTGNPQDIGLLFKLNLSKKDSLDLWFTPIDFSLSNAIVYIDRTEILYNKGYEIAVWGKLDMLKNYATMTLGLTEQSLRKALGVRGLPRTFVLQLPMEGPINDVKIQKEIATTRLALFLAKTTGVTNYGGLWGGIASALSDFANDQTMVPPAKPPYPWEGKLSLFEEEQKKHDTVNIIR